MLWRESDIEIAQRGAWIGDSITAKKLSDVSRRATGVFKTASWRHEEGNAELPHHGDLAML